ncbi:hypothetical protein EKO29_02605 [Colwellia sp. Arc7-635]|jgi:hypothetical protein|uniref:hypothetical protein n=1 Tax=Colwellia sp. Arc7-635 TaxID=2497879 RepID=UPI000F84F824|nr:hypothetical protein [Colwellia sp. Arc7-635]AZQ83046.1 hypothetical protein EKO29_02605 [Colwellia sp. Arc7-635]
MSFFKALFLAIFATIFLTYVLGTSFIDLLNVDIYMDEKLIEPLKAISISALVVVILVLVALAIAMSVFGSLIFVAMLVLGGCAMLLVGVFWPIFLAAGVIWLITRDKRAVQY